MLRGVAKVILGKVGRQHTGTACGKPDMTASDKLQIPIVLNITHI